MKLAARIEYDLKRVHEALRAPRANKSEVLLQGLALCIDKRVGGEDRKLPVLTVRHSLMDLHPKQHAAWHDPARFIVLPCGRRSGKTELLKRKIIKEAAREPFGTDAWYVLGAPTHLQAKRIFWRDIKRLIPVWAITYISESELTIRLLNGAEITVMGMDVPERAEGRPISGLGLDEYGNMREDVWGEHLRAGLVDKQGWCWFTGVPEGRNHYYNMSCDARADESGEWAVHHWTTIDILALYLGAEAAAREIASAKRQLDELTFEQEFLASFVSFFGLAYYGWTNDSLVKGLPYDDEAPLIFTFDFNVAPGTAGVVQEHDKLGTCVIGEVHIPRNSNTPRVCRKLIQDWGKHKGSVRCYGDATGGAKGSAKIQGSDWDLIVNELRPVFGSRLVMRVPKANPRERVRVNAVNSRVHNKAGERKLLVDPARAPYTVKDFEGVRVLEGSAGEIDKKSDPDLTHHTDGLGYYIVKAHPTKTTLGVKTKTI